MKVIISGGGTGGHVYPAIAIAHALKSKTDVDILFVGAKGKLEMEKVPAAGYPIKGLWISGFHRKKLYRNALFPLKVLSSLWASRKIIDNFKPDVVVGVGGYASGPLLKVAASKGIPTLIQEQNSYPGITNRILARSVDAICVAYDGLDRFFPSEKIILTGNPVRKDIADLAGECEEGYAHFKLDKSKKTVFIFGGSLGARSINDAVRAQYDAIAAREDVQLLWQVGKIYFDEFSRSDIANLDHIRICPFIDRMDLAYGIADIIICRAGASTISEISLVGKAAILVPSPNVAEDHQTKNAQALVEKDAAVIIPDAQASEMMIQVAFNLIDDNNTRKRLGEHLKYMGKPDAVDEIADAIIKLANKV